jgi:hypothetical protein
MSLHEQMKVAGELLLTIVIASPVLFLIGNWWAL